ncbi:GNAT family N-acetyltransferase [Pseudomonas cuatrocienegasensis]
MRAQADDVVWVAQQGELLAALCLRQLDEGYWLTRLFVAPAQRRQGLAARLLNAACESCQAPVWLLCHPDLSDFYAAHGFVPCSAPPLFLAERLMRYQRHKLLIAMVRRQAAADQWLDGTYR